MFVPEGVGSRATDKAVVSFLADLSKYRRKQERIADRREHPSP
jgi:hypothetical protein